MFKKVILLFFVLLLLLVPCVSVFASTPVHPNGEVYQGDFYFDQVYEQNYDIIDFVECTQISDGRTKVNIRLKGDMFVGNKFYFVVRLGVLPSIVNGGGVMLGNFTVITDTNLTIRKGLSEFYRYRENSDGTVQYTQKADEVIETDYSYPTQDRIKVVYSTQPNGDVPKYYMCAIALECLVSDYGYNLYFDNLNGFTIEDYNVYVGETVLDLEQNRAQAGGNSALSGAADSMGSADKSSGFFNSLQRLASSMSYSNTASVWKVPSIVLPKINGIMEETKLTDEITIDFRQYVRMLPDDILKLIQGVLTIALIVYCFKELYNIISYLFTLKGRGADE